MFSIDNSARSLFSTTIRKSILPTRKISSRTDVSQAVYDVYKSPTIFARLMRGRGSIASSVYPILGHIGCRIYTFFNDSPNTTLSEIHYDTFFYELCDYFQDEYNKLAASANIVEIQFGIAQKLINVVFKYLSCYDDYMVFADLFMYCHMPIDSYVLHYFKTMSIVSKIKSSFSLTMPSPYALFDGSTWSHLSKDEYKKLVKEYRTALTVIYPGYTSLHEEYYIWQMVKSRIIGPIVFHVSLPLPGSKSKFFM